MISRQYQCIFVHIPKTAGTSLETALGYNDARLVRGRQDHRRLRNIEQAIWPPSRRRYAPLDFARFASQRIHCARRGFEVLSYGEFRRFYKFAIVRNPWDRVYSWYRNVIRDPVHQRELSVAPDCSFDEFVDRHLDCWALDTQVSWLRNESGEIAVDFIGRFEALGDAFREISKVLGLDDQSLPHALDSGGSDYRRAYSGASRDRVATRYAEEIRLFDYSFE